METLIQMILVTSMRRGSFIFLNRRKDLIISGGENIYPKELEDLVYTLPSVKECAVVPVPDTKWGQVPALFVAFLMVKVCHQRIL